MRSSVLIATIGCLSQSAAAMDVPVLLDIPPRYMWGWSPPAWAVGYCGSMSLQSVGLYYGNWITQDAGRLTNGNHTAESSLLLGGHHEVDTYPSSEAHALKVLSFNYTSWDDRSEPQPQHVAYLQWIRNAIDAGDPVIFGAYMRNDDDVDYDHIMPVVGYDSTGIYFNDLHATHTLRYELSTFVQTRKQCQHGPTEFDYCLPPEVDYGIQVHGNADEDKVLLPVRLIMELDREPDYSEEDGHHEPPTELKATLNVTQLQPGASYALLRYEDAADVPSRDFLQSGFTERHDFVAPDAGFAEFPTSFMSNSTQFFRCVQNGDSVDAAEVVV